ncbi:MAG: hypothetical protein NXI32_09300 [bacterium]|nr:hypothetical protein [bacterium]
MRWLCAALLLLCVSGCDDKSALVEIEKARAALAVAESELKEEQAALDDLFESVRRMPTKPPDADYMLTTRRQWVEEAEQNVKDARARLKELSGN